MIPSPASRIGRAAAALALSAILAGLSFLAIAADVEYTYDEIGRLVGVYAPSGDAAQYVYDPAGNITQINRFTASQLSVIEFTPNSGPIGTTVTIWGTGFSTTPGNNAVTFNGTAATVSAATANKLTVTVPSGATTGAIGVVVGANTASSATNFTVVASSGVPTITSFSPAGGAAGAAVTITGTNFETTAANNYVNFNLTAATASSATSTSISTTVPTNTGSGKIKVRTINGTAYSSNDFLVPFGTYTAADLVSSARATVNGTAATFSIGTAGKVGMVLFEGTQGQNLGIAFSSFVFSPAGGSATITILRPDNVLLRPVTAIPSGNIDLPTLPLTGTYTIAIVPPSTRTLNGTVTISTDVTGSLGSAGTITNSATTRVGQNGRYTFDGTAGQSVAIYVFGVASAIRTITISLIDPYGWPIASNTPNNTADASAYIQAQTLLATGKHTVRVKVGADSVSPGAFSIQYGMPDLTITSLTPGTPFPNQDGSYSVPMTAVIANQGTVGVKGLSWKDSAYLSTDTTLDTSDRFLIYVARNTDIASGASYTVTPTGIAPIGTATGSYSLIFKADAADNGTFYVAGDFLKESNETNNTATASITIPGLPDLVISNLAVGTVTGNKDATYNIPVTFTVTNSGAAPAKSSWYDECFLSSDATLSTTDPLIGYTGRFSDLAVSGSYNVSTTCVALATATPGSYTLFARTDGNDFGANYFGNQRVVESNETNNTASTALTLPAQADIAITSSSVGTITVNGDGSRNIPVTFTVQNVGTGLPAKGGWYDACYLSSDGSLTTADDYLGSQYRATDLTASSQYTVNMTCVTPTTTTAGNYTLFLKADGFHSGTKYSAFEFLVEPNETNNVVSISITLP